jgi:FolB domain-containing protein
MLSTLSIPKLSLWPNLGVTPLERSKVQLVEAALCLEFNTLPPACFSDEITQTFCYHTFRDNALTLIKSQQFKLIEHLTYALTKIIVEQLQTQRLGSGKITLTIKKVTIPLDEVSEGALFSIVRSFGSTVNEQV